MSFPGEKYVAAPLGSGMRRRLDAGWLLSAEETLRREGAALSHDEGVAVLLTQVEAFSRHASASGDMAERLTGHLSYAYAVDDNVRRLGAIARAPHCFRRTLTRLPDKPTVEENEWRSRRHRAPASPSRRRRPKPPRPL
ncbi:MAG TPA: hypothetical protein VMD51_15825 [Mycobacterium sp.]|nr:hypothetical protein [Mycobacterium sp.]